MPPRQRGGGELDQRASRRCSGKALPHLWSFSTLRPTPAFSEGSDAPRRRVVRTDLGRTADSGGLPTGRKPVPHEWGHATGQPRCRVPGGNVHARGDFGPKFGEGPLAPLPTWRSSGFTSHPAGDLRNATGHPRRNRCLHTSRYFNAGEQNVPSNERVLCNPALVAEAGISIEEQLARAAVELSSRSILELVAKSGSDAEALRGGLEHPAPSQVPCKHRPDLRASGRHHASCWRRPSACP
jgi:hypothetical protein